MEFKTLCIFTPCGKTFTFKAGRVICDNESILQFEYAAMSDGYIKVATFPKSNIAGWSVALVDFVVDEVVNN